MNTESNCTDLLQLITDKTPDEISGYLGDVSVNDFKNDIQELIKKSVDKEPIRQALEYLKKFL